jgi:predicted TIM-barrel fold metal-dependent hydrolase
MMAKQIILLLMITLLSGCQKRFYTEDDFKSVLKIDSHIHINSDDGVFEDQAAADNFLLITLNVDHSHTPYLDDQLNLALNSVQKHPGKVFYGPTFFFDTTGWNTIEWSNKVISQIEKGISGGAISVKVWKNIGMTVRDRSGKFIMIDDPALDPVFNYIISKGLPVTGHLGEPRNCWLPLDEMTVRSDSNYFSKHPEYHMFLHPEFPSYEDQIRARDNLLIRHPDLTFIGCHLGSLEWNVDSLASRLEKFPNMAVDISARTCHLQFQSSTDRERVRDFMIKYQDRLLYGTDVDYTGSNNPESFRKKMHETWTDDWKYFATNLEMTSEKFAGKFTGLQLPVEVINKLYYDNAVKWYKLPVNN